MPRIVRVVFIKMLTAKNYMLSSLNCLIFVKWNTFNKLFWAYFKWEFSFVRVEIWISNIEAMKRSPMSPHI
jgi:hypothetical protein